MIAPLDELLHCLHGVFQSKPDTAMLYGAVQYGSRSVRPLGVVLVLLQLVFLTCTLVQDVPIMRYLEYLPI